MRSNNVHTSTHYVFLLVVLALCTIDAHDALHAPSLFNPANAKSMGRTTSPHRIFTVSSISFLARNNLCCLAAIP
ncbi:hypothetical protein J3F84DRAFT_361329 [Trichoderma pleuroticola]